METVDDVIAEMTGALTAEGVGDAEQDQWLGGLVGRLRVALAAERINRPGREWARQMQKQANEMEAALLVVAERCEAHPPMLQGTPDSCALCGFNPRMLAAELRQIAGVG